MCSVQAGTRYDRHEGSPGPRRSAHPQRTGVTRGMQRSTRHVACDAPHDTWRTMHRMARGVRRPTRRGMRRTTLARPPLRRALRAARAPPSLPPVGPTVGGNDAESLAACWHAQGTCSSAARSQRCATKSGTSRRRTSRRCWCRVRGVPPPLRALLATACPCRGGGVAACPGRFGIGSAPGSRATQRSAASSPARLSEATARGTASRCAKRRSVCPRPDGAAREPAAVHTPTLCRSETDELESREVPRSARANTEGAHVHTLARTRANTRARTQTRAHARARGSSSTLARSSRRRRRSCCATRSRTKPRTSSACSTRTGCCHTAVQPALRCRGRGRGCPGSHRPQQRRPGARNGRQNSEPHSLPPRTRSARDRERLARSPSHSG
jgi:hypothetical protein